MKHFKSFFLVALSCVVMNGCKEKIELSEVDTSVYVNTNIAAPIVTIHAPLSQIIGFENNNEQSEMMEWLYVKDDNLFPYDAQLRDVPNGTLYFRDTFPITRNFHPIILSDFIQPIVIDLNVYEQINTALGLPPMTTPVTIPAGTPLNLSFPLTVKLSGLNNSTTYDRVDSMKISKASFNSFINTNFGLQNADITSITLKLPKEFTKNQMPMSDMDITPFIDEQDTTRLEMENFEISMQTTGANATNRRQHMTDSLTFTVQFAVITTHPITFDPSSSINYTFDVALLTYDALWGYFTPSDDMADNDTILLAEHWPTWNDIKRLKMQFAYPSIRLIAEHQIATEEGHPLHVNLSHIGVAQADESGKQIGELTCAKFGIDGTEESTVWQLYDIQKSQITRIDPLKDPFDKVSRNELIVGYSGYEEGTHVGDVEKLFQVKPDVIGYKYDITIGPKNNPSVGSQCRVTNNTDINLRAVTVVPFVCDKGSELEFNDTVEVDFSKVDFDSITQSAQWLDSVIDGAIYLYLEASNSIPFDVTAQYAFYDKNNSEVVLPLVTDNEGKGATYKMTIPAPTKYADNKATEPGKNTIILRVSKKEFEKLNSIRKIIFTVSLDNNPQRVIIWTDSGLEVKVGVSASVEAILNINTNKNK